MSSSDLRIVSLIPSATEIVAALGYGEFLVGRSHECDFPESVRDLPICTEPKFDPVGTSSEIHERVSNLLREALSVYRVKTAVLADLKPTHIITQAQCEVCAVSLSDVEQAVKQLVSSADSAADIQVISLQPERLADVWTDMERVAAALDASAVGQSTAKSVIERLQARLQTVETKSHPTIACIEWTEPLMAAGNWVPELVTLAGGKSCFGKAGAHSDWMSWAELTAADPDIIIVMPCGYDLEQTRQATAEMAAHAEWPQLKAAQTSRVYVTDGNQYFNRPGPRLVESGEILAEIIQGKPVAKDRQPAGWELFKQR
ncbi:MAG: cobalamin-binding protein [Phormidesmis sp.]